MTINLNKNTIYYEDDIIKIIKKLNPSISDTKIKWMLFEMEKKSQITKIGIKKYITNGNSYNYKFESAVSNNIVTILNDNFKEIKTIVFETRQLNEWVNLLLSKNLIIVEVESGFESIIFDKLMECLGNKYTVLLSPNDEIISRYLKDELIIIKTLYSRSPINKKNHSITLEKLIVDCISNKFLYNLLGTSGIEYVIKGIKNNYTINESKLLTYAKRRNKDKELSELWGSL